MGNLCAKRLTNAMHERSTDKIWLEKETLSIRGEQYKLLERRGNGSFGTVWVSATPSGFRAAVKVFDLRHRVNHIRSLRLTRSFENEVRMAYEMRNAGDYAATIYGFDFDRQRHIALIAMELGDDSLKNRVQSLHQAHKPSETTGYDYIPAIDRKNIWIQLVNILLALDGLHVIHRDVKPSNLVFFGPVMKLIDFGIAQKEFTENQRLIGDKSYGAPECLMGGAPITTKADIWSAGGILYYMTYGVKPVYRSPRPPPNTPGTNSTLIKNLLRRCFRPSPNKRAGHRWLAQHPLTSSDAVL